MAKRIGLLTLPLHSNYGGIIQAIALYHFLESTGFTPTFLRKEPELPLIKSLFRSTVGRILKILPVDINGYRSRAIHERYIRKAMPNSSAPLRTTRELSQLVHRDQLDAVVVGSDQVWRLDYHGDTNHMRYFLDFISEKSVLKVAYAASFGVSEWNHPQYTQQVRQLLSRFDAVSVREESGRQICASEFGLPDCFLALDPTLLVEPSFYENMLQGTRQVIPAGSVFRYVLDPGPAVDGAVKQAVALHGEDSGISVNARTAKVDLPHWVRAFKDAGFVVTDSFHGTIFSIIFRKPFVAIANRQRGLDRFTSLLDQLGIRERLLDGHDEKRLSELISTPIDYDTVTQRLMKMRAESRSFLLSALE